MSREGKIMAVRVFGLASMLVVNVACAMIFKLAFLG